MLKIISCFSFERYLQIIEIKEININTYYRNLLQSLLES